MQRLDILLNGAVIDKETHSFSNQIMGLLMEKYGFKQDSLDMLITHLAMAHQRIKSKSKENPVLDADSIAEMSSHHLFEEAKKIWAEISALSDIEYPENEIEFMTAHLINLLDGE
ncbi:MAG: PRD domain-containing protein [Elusimicrobiota bacterium]|jgi:hypothetical protein|nr:PRD domain-containing protein [Elusimicrobiota bacterium]